MKNQFKYVKPILQIMKYVYFLSLLAQGAIMVHKPLLFICGTIEILAIAVITGYISNRKRVLGYVLNSIFLTIIGVELIVFRFSGGYISLIMVTNLNSIEGISGKVYQYVIYIVLFVIALVIPTPILKTDKINKKYNKVIIISLNVLLEVLVLIKTNWSPIENSFFLASDLWKRHETYVEITKSGNYDIEELNKTFYKDTVGNNISSPFKEEKPDIVLIFTEGLSQNIIDDEREIMPNVKKYQEKSLSFCNYYNHTAATYRGIIGQLYSGHQCNNYDENPLISMQKIMNQNGYETTLINTEPNNETFSKYLGSLGFDEIVTDENSETWLTDDKAYELLTDEVMKKHKSSKPQFIVIYTFGSHVTFDNTNYKYGDGSNGLLNRFTNVDHYYGQFMDNFIDNEEYNDLAIIFTTDHCTNEDEDFIKTFEPEYKRDDFFCDKIPFFIWYNEVEPTKIDAGGRNSLCMAPTVLDYFDIDGANYFLGRSLFSENDDEYLLDKVYSIPDSGYYRYTTINSIRDLTEEERNQVNTIIQKYLSYTIKVTEN